MVRHPFARALIITSLVGILLISLPPLALLSYDLSFLTRPGSSVTNLVVIYANQETREKLGSEHGDLSRTNHARLLNRLTQEKARLVFYDFAFTAADPSPENDTALAEAIQRNGSVILVAAAESIRDHDTLVRKLTAPTPALRKASAGWGHAELMGNVVRTISPDFEGHTYAVWAAISRLLSREFDQSERNVERWLNYYGVAESTNIAYCYFHVALSSNGLPAGYFQDQIVFVGQKYPVEQLARAKDVFPTPYSRFGQAPLPGVAIHATAFLNLLRHEWLWRIPWIWQCVVVAGSGIVIAAALYQLSRKPLWISLAVGASAAAVICVLSLSLQWKTHGWWSWIGPAFGQPLAAILWTRFHPKPLRHLAFISYRSEEDGAGALLVAQALSDRGYKAFIDVKSLEAGHFDEQLLREIDNAAFFIIMVSPNSLARCVEKGDWVLRELSHAITTGKKIIPVFKGGFSFRTARDVPDLPEIAKLATHHGVAFSNRDFDGFMRQLIKLMRVP